MINSCCRQVDVVNDIKLYKWMYKHKLNKNSKWVESNVWHVCVDMCKNDVIDKIEGVVAEYKIVILEWKVGHA